MTNEEKAKEIVNQVLPCPYPSGYSVMMHGYELEKIAVLAAEWKEQQMMNEFRKFLNKIGRGQQFGQFERMLKEQSEKL